MGLRSVQSLSDCTRVTFTFTFMLVIIKILHIKVFILEYKLLIKL